MQKRIADWLEKLSVGCLLVGLFQDNPNATGATWVGFIALGITLLLTRRLK